MEERAESLDHMFSVAYEQLRSLAARVRVGEANDTINTTALVNEAYLKLAGSQAISAESELHFKRIAARAMRQVLVEAARRRMALKRGSDSVKVQLNEDLDAAPSTPDHIIALNTALEELATVNQRQALTVEYRFFGGFDLCETARLLNVSERTVTRDWRMARAWLGVEIRRALQP